MTSTYLDAVAQRVVIFDGGMGTQIQEAGVTADDFGLTPATSEACVLAHQEGVVTAVSLLGNGAATEASLELLRSAPDLAVGAHLALVGEDPPRSAPNAIPSLVDSSGALRLTWREFLRDLARGRVDLAHVRIELDAQLGWLAESVDQLSHVNLHQHLQLWPSIGALTIDLAQEHGIGFVRTPTSDARGPRGVAIRHLTGRFRGACRRAGLATTDGFAGLDEAGGWNADALDRALLRSAGGSLELNLHPGPPGDSDRDRFAWGYAWGDELALLLDPVTRERIAAGGWTLARPSDVVAATEPMAGPGI